MKVAASQLRMTDGEAEAFLAAQRWARIASVSAEGEPHVTPVGFVLLDGRIYFYAKEDARRTRDVRAGSRVAVCVDAGLGDGEGYSQRKGIVVYGTCRIVARDETELVARVLPAYARAQFNDPAVAFQRWTHVWFEVTPYRRISWDFGKIPAGADRFSSS